jgi:hypothetical protein
LPRGRGESERTGAVPTGSQRVSPTHTSARGRVAPYRLLGTRCVRFPTARMGSWEHWSSTGHRRAATSPLRRPIRLTRRSAVADAQTARREPDRSE